MDWAFTIVGGLLIAFCLVQLAFWTATTFGRQISESQYWQLQRELLLAKIEVAQAQRQLAAQSLSALPNTNTVSAPEVAWRGWRKFRVKKLVRETPSTTSVYLVPHDGLDLPEFKPGQFLTFKFELPNQAAPQIRCYSLSDGPHSQYYRITVKDVHGKPQDLGGVSHFVNWQWAVGDMIEVKAPNGDFFLDLQRSEPAILLAGGVGITPLMSMIETVLMRGDRRDLLLFYGLRHGGEHIFKDRLRKLAAENSTFNVLHCYSEPGNDDVEGRDYHYRGRISIELLQQALPNPNFQFYLCGPETFMSSLHGQLRAWGVPEDNIHFEAFGPATIKTKGKPGSSIPTMGAPATGIATKIHFAKSNKVVDWTEQQGTLLDVGLGAGVAMTSGCRAGQCGSCETKLLRGEVVYPQQQPLDVEAGHCLPCIAVPKATAAGSGEVVLDA